jgi:hypothetical protein
MVRKRKFGKNSKLKYKMKGGEEVKASEYIPMPGAKTQEDFEKFHKNNPLNFNPPKEKRNLSRRLKAAGAVVSNYGSYKMSFFVSVISAIGIVGIGWLLVSRSIIRHKNSEALSYTLISLAVFLSFFLVLVSALGQFKLEEGIINLIKYIFKIVIYCLTNSLPAILIFIQTATLVWLFSKHSDYLFSTTNLPELFNTFNMMAMVMVAGQAYVWKEQLETVLIYADNKYEKAPKRHTLVAGFILAAILSGVAISQMYVILEYLKTDC